MFFAARGRAGTALRGNPTGIEAGHRETGPRRTLCFCTALLAVAVILISGLPDALADQGERILFFQSHVRILPQGDLEVIETIRVRAAGDRIQRGIYRDFPTDYRSDLGHRVRVRFEVLAVQRDGRAEPYHSEALSGGVRVYIGHRDVFLQPGEYTYTLAYRCDRQIGFFTDYDELYWNVTGNDWELAIEEARAVIDLPPGAPVRQHAAYTGPAGATGGDYRIESGEGDLVFATTRVLQPREGLTVAVAWPKGFVAEPTPADRMADMVQDNLSMTVALAGLALLLLYYGIAWWKVGRDPARGTIIPRYAPPKGVSPAAARFVMRMGFDQKALAVAVVSMAVKGFLKITEGADGVYSLEATGAGAERLSAGEARVAAALLPAGSGPIRLQHTSHRKVGAATKALRHSLGGEYERQYFLHNTGYFIPGIVISLIVLAAVIFTGDMVPVAIFMLVWISFWSVGVYGLAVRVVTAWRSRQVAGAVAVTLFSLPFFGAEIFAVGLLANAVTPPSLILLLSIVGVNILFYHLFKAPTLAGRRLMDEIEGLKRYLSVAEQDRLNKLHPPERTPEHFEALLPYAMALDVENQWSAQFADVLEKAAREVQAGQRSGFSWYHGRSSFKGLAADLGGAFAGAVASSSRAPGSSSGSRGGGSSGGGGGGGGGGGW
jgi:hypothetical protein